MVGGGKALAVTLGVGLGGGAAAYFDAARKTALPQVHCQRTPLNESLLSSMPHLQQPLVPVPFMTNRHVETIGAALMRRSPGYTYRRELLRAEDGGTVVLDWPMEQQRAMDAGAVDPASPLVILFPGLTGGSHDTYVQYAVGALWAAGYRAVVFNSRGTSDGPVTSPQFYSASFTCDSRQVVEHCAALFPAAPLVGCGWSLGANILVNFLGEEGDAARLTAAVSMCNPFDLLVSNRHITTGFNRLYDYNLAKSLRGIFTRHRSLFEGSDVVLTEMAAECKSIREFDEAVTHRVFGWDSVDQYYQESGSCRAIPRVAVPLLCVQALDDPIAPAEAIPYAAIEGNPNCILVTTETGGHLGWVHRTSGVRGGPWTDPLVAQFVDAVAKHVQAGLIPAAQERRRALAERGEGAVAVAEAAGGKP